MIERKYKTDEERDTIIAEMEADGYALVAYHNADVLRFVTVEEKAIRDRADALHGLNATDKDMARGVEDLYQTLVTKGVIVGDDLPQDFRDKIAARTALRAKL